jgi:hypothetical protein
MEGNVLYAGGSITVEGANFVTAWSKNVFYSGAGKIVGTRLDGYKHLGASPGEFGDTRTADPMFVDLEKQTGP